MRTKALTNGRRGVLRAGGASGWLLASLLLAPWPLVSRGAAQPPAGGVHVLAVEGVINPLTVRYLDRGLDRAVQDEAGLVVIELNTPGGLETSMREMVAAILASPVPVAVYVTPSGGRAASAGMFITMAGHVAAMAPGTNIGAAHPVGLGTTSGEVVQQKVVRDAAALARSIATARGRNAGWAEKAVLESASITAAEAREQDVIDLVAADLDELLARLDGRRVVAAGREAMLDVGGAPRRRMPMSLPERIVHWMTDPNVAYLLFSLGMIGLMAELYNPGLLFPGITGAVSLVIAFVAFGSLPLNWGAIGLLVLAAGLLVAELYTEGTGIASIGGAIAFTIGSLMLYQPFETASPAMPDVRVSPWLIVLMTAAIVGFFAFVVRALVRAQRAPVLTGIQRLVGGTGTAVTPLRPEGTVRVNSERWHAVSETGELEEGEEVRIVGVEGVTLRVARAQSRPERIAAAG